MSLYYDSGVLVKLYVREELSDTVIQFLQQRGEIVIVNSLHELEIRNALRLKRFRNEIDGEQLAASMNMIAGDLAGMRLIRCEFSWQAVCERAERLSAAATTRIGVRTIDLLHVAAALDRSASGLVSLDRRQRAAADAAGLDIVDFTD